MFFLDCTEHGFALEPFQLLYTTSTNESISFDTGSMNGMGLLEATRTHLAACLQDDPFFVRLTLYFSVRSKELDMFQNGTKVAYSGKAYYTLPSSVVNNDGQVASDAFLCFVGANETRYVDSLQSMGWDIVEQAQIMTISGDMIAYVDGEMVVVETNDNDDDEPSTSAMTPHTSTFIYLVATLVPLSVVVFLGLGWCLYRISISVSFRSPKTANANNPMWSVHHPDSQEHRRATLKKQSTTQAPPLATDHTSVQGAV